MEHSQNSPAEQRQTRVRLRPRKCVKVEAESKPKKISNAERCALYRARRNADPEHLEDYKREERDRSRMRRCTMSDQQRQKFNELARVRNAKCRAKKKQEQQMTNVAQIRRRISRCLDTNIEVERKEKDRERKQMWRDSLTPQKRRFLNEQRRRRYYKQKEAKKNNARIKVNEDQTIL